jgi:lysozyme
MRKWLLATLAVAGVTLGLIWYSTARHNSPSEQDYPVHGIDVSAHQGEIDWPTLAEGQDFAFIKATEGSTFVDKRFATNWPGAQAAGLAVGAYHFFSFESPGTTQAANFIKTVPLTPGALPPVVDLEFYDLWSLNPPAIETVRAELDALLADLKTHYGQPPIIYVDTDMYSRYLAGSYADNPLWVRDLRSKPKLPNDRAWTFWQYADNAKLSGYTGDEDSIDLNVFAGNAEDLASLLRPG